VRLDIRRMRFGGAIAVALIAGSAFAAEIPPADRRSGYDFMKPDTRAMQDEDTANPGMLWVLDGEALWKRKLGAANKACADCHDDNWDKRLAGSAITQAHPTGYPLYRLEWQSLGSLQRRLRACITGIRAQAYDYGAPELVDLELYLMSRARGMPMEAPA